MDKSNGYEGIAASFIKHREKDFDGIGTASVRAWVRTLAKNSTLLDLGCGSGIPISKVLIDEGVTVYGIDASHTMVKTFQQNFPNNPVACEAIEDSTFFNRKFEGIVAWGLLFLLTEEAQEIVIRKAALALQPKGRLLFTAPDQKCDWKDVMTKQQSISLGASKYRELLTASGLSLVEEFNDEGENHYFSVIKI